jgi:ABC-type phosphate transport system substrate-binding protein
MAVLSWVLAAAALAFALAPAPARASDAIVVIANAELAELEEATLPLLRQLFLGRRTRVAGSRVHLVEPAPGTALRRAFARLVLERSERELERYWLEQALSGGPPPPREIASDAELVRRVAARRGALGYLAWAAFARLPHDGVRVVRVRDGERLLGPEDAGYPLRFAAPQAPGGAGRKGAE